MNMMQLVLSKPRDLLSIQEGGGTWNTRLKLLDSLLAVAAADVKQE
jgi:hypothetical protein